MAGKERTIKKSTAKDWLVVPKPNKAFSNDAMKNRCWRLSFQDYEREMLKESHHLKKVMRLMKKLRNALNMKAIASYYIKTLFLWKIEKENKQYWQNKLSVLFRAMLEEFYNAIKIKNIPYFWNKNNNLIDSLKPGLQKQYEEKLKTVLDSIAVNDVDKTIYAMLEPDEIKQFKSSELYQKQATPTVQTKPVRSMSVASSSSSQEFQVNSISSQVDYQQTSLLTAIMEKLDLLTQKLELQEERLLKLEAAHKQSEKSSMAAIPLNKDIELLGAMETVEAPRVDILHGVNLNAAPQIESDVLISF